MTAHEPTRTPATDRPIAGESRPDPRPGRAVIPTIAVATLVAETGLLAYAASGGRPLLALGGHLLVLAGLGVWAWRHSRRTTRDAALLWVATASFGPFGAGGLLVTMILERHYARHATAVDAWHAMLFPPTQVDVQADLWRRVGQRASDRGAEPRVTPFLDVFAFGSIPQRQAAIAIIAQQFHPAFAPALRAALRDQHNVVRVQAATAIARLEQEFLERTLRLEAAVDANPDDGGAVVALARHYDEQAFAGLLDPGREEACRVKAAEGYQRVLAVHAGDADVRFRLARLQQRRRLWHEAEVLLRPLVEADHASARVWLMENLFEQRCYAELRRIAAMEHRPAPDAAMPEVPAVMAMWAGEGSAA
jgi:hypothetical protein